MSDQVKLYKMSNNALTVYVLDTSFTRAVKEAQELLDQSVCNSSDIREAKVIATELAKNLVVSNVIVREVTK